MSDPLDSNFRLLEGRVDRCMAYRIVSAPSRPINTALSGRLINDTLILSILLIGQQELWHTLRIRVFEPFFYSITSHFHLQSLSVKDTREYIAHQLRLSNLDMLFPDDVVGKIHHTTP